jgi:hypothetical protein
MVIYFFGGWNSPKIILADPHQGSWLYLLGLLIVALYAPLYWWRAWQDRRLAAAGWLPAHAAGVAAAPASSADLKSAASWPMWPARCSPCRPRNWKSTFGAPFPAGCSGTVGRTSSPPRPAALPHGRRKA